MFLRDGDVNTKFFHLQAWHKGCKNTIAQFVHHGVVIVDEELKAQVVFDHFDQILGTMEEWVHGVDLEHLALPQ
jgi:hypothetical protein